MYMYVGTISYNLAQPSVPLFSNPAGTRRNNNVFITSKRRRRRNEDVIIASLLRYVSIGTMHEHLISINVSKKLSERQNDMSNSSIEFYLTFL